MSDEDSKAVAETPAERFMNKVTDSHPFFMLYLVYLFLWNTGYFIPLVFEASPSVELPAFQYLTIVPMVSAVVTRVAKEWLLWGLSKLDHYAQHKTFMTEEAGRLTVRLNEVTKERDDLVIKDSEATNKIEAAASAYTTLKDGNDSLAVELKQMTEERDVLYDECNEAKSNVDRFKGELNTLEKLKDNLESSNLLLKISLRGMGKGGAEVEQLLMLLQSIDSKGSMKGNVRQLSRIIQKAQARKINSNDDILIEAFSYIENEAREKLDTYSKSGKLTFDLTEPISNV